MAAAIVKKAFDNHENQLNTGLNMYIALLDKFALKAFNQLFYNQEVDGLFVISFLLNLPDYYTPKTSFKNINLSTLKAKFLVFLTNFDFS